MNKKRLIFVSLCDLRKTPYAELALPVLAQHGWNITVAATGATKSVVHRVAPYPSIRHDLNCGVWIQHEMSVLRALLEARFGPYDVIYLNSQALSLRAAFAYRGPFMGKRLVYQTHDYYDPITYPLRTRLEASVCRMAHCHLNGEFHRGYIYRGQYGLKCPVVIVPPNLPAAWPIPNRCEDTRRQMGAEHDDDVLLMLHGGYSELRATKQILEALAILPKRFRLVMTSSGPKEQYVAQLLVSLGISERVVRLPRLDFCDMLRYSVNADIGLLLHANNDLGNFFQAPGRLTEYLACGLPVLASHYTGLEATVFRRGIGRVADPTSSMSIAEGVLAIEQDLQIGNYSRALIRKRFLDHFAFDLWEKEVADTFDGLLEDPESRTPAEPPKYVPMRAAESSQLGFPKPEANQGETLSV